MKKLRNIVSVILALMLLVYAGWSNYDKAHSIEKIFPRYVISNLEEIGQNNGRGNVMALSPYLHPYDFSSEEAFYNMLQYYFSFAQNQKLFNDSTVVVLPEYMGSWLVVANEKRSIYADTSVADGMKMMALSNIFKFGFAYLKSHGTDKQKETIFRMKAGSMLDIYQQTFSRLSKDFGVTIVAGSVVLPEPTVDKDGKIHINTFGKLYNVTAVFDRKGKVMSPLTKKIFPIEEEKGFISQSDKPEIPVYKTLAGNVAVLICADAWYPQNYALLKNKNIDILAVPSFVSGKDAWQKTWKGYDGAKMPADIDASDIGKIMEQDAWLKYAMTDRIQQTAGIKVGVNVFLRGDFWNLGSDGYTLMWNQGVPMKSKEITDKTGSLINIWL